MDEPDRLREMFDYDRWANLRWRAHLASIGFPEPDRSVFQHSLAAQEIWALRCRGTSPSRMPEPEPSGSTLDRLHGEWLSLLADLAHDPVIAYRRTTGQALSMSFFRIARHVANHGTYHRGELRGLCRARNDEGFPETDYAAYVFDAGLESPAGSG